MFFNGLRFGLEEKITAYSLTEIVLISHIIGRLRSLDERAQTSNNLARDSFQTSGHVLHFMIFIFIIVEINRSRLNHA